VSTRRWTVGSTLLVVQSIVLVFVLVLLVDARSCEPPPDRATARAEHEVVISETCTQSIDENTSLRASVEELWGMLVTERATNNRLKMESAAKAFGVVRLDFDGADLGPGFSPSDVEQAAGLLEESLDVLPDDREAEFVGVECSSVPCVVAAVVRLEWDRGRLGDEDLVVEEQVLAPVRNAMAVATGGGASQTVYHLLPDGRSLTLLGWLPKGERSTSSSGDLKVALETRIQQLLSAKNRADLLSLGYESSFVDDLVLVGHLAP